MNICFLTTDTPDPFQDTLFRSLRTLYGSSCIDIPRKEILYDGTVDDPIIDRDSIETRLRSGEIDLLIFGNIAEQRSMFNFFYAELVFEQIKAQSIFLNGSGFPYISETGELGPTFCPHDRCDRFSFPCDIHAFELSPELPALALLEQIVEITDPETTF